MSSESQWLNVQDVAELLQIQNETVRRWIRRNELPVLELGGPRAGYRIRRDDLDHFIWQRYRMRNQNDADREFRTDFAQSAADTSTSGTLRVETVQDERRDASQHVSASMGHDRSGTALDAPYSSLMRRMPGMTYVGITNPESTDGARRRVAYISDEFDAALGGMSNRIRRDDDAWWDMVHPDDRRSVQESRVHSCRTGERLSIEYRVLPPGSDAIWVHDEAVLGDDSGNDDPLWQGIVVNISDRKRVEDSLRARIRQQEAVAELGEHALQSVEPGILFTEAVRYVSQTLNVEYAKVLELQPGGETLLLRAGVGWRTARIGRSTVGAGADSQAGYTLLSNEPVIVQDLQKETRFTGPSLLHDHGVRSGISAIIAGHGKPFGVIGAHTTAVRKFSGDDVAFLQSVANILASAVIAAERQPDGGRWLSIRDVANSLKVTEETVRRWIRRGELPVIDLGSSRAGYRIHPVDLELFIHERYMKP